MQQETLLALAWQWFDLLPAAHARARKQRFLDRMGEIRFAWSGPVAAGSDVSWTVQGPSMVIEYANDARGGADAGNPVDHVHTVYRDLDRDYGGPPVPAGRRSEARAAGRPTAVPCPVRIQPALSSGRVVNAAWTGDSVQLREVAAPSGGTVSSPASPGSRLSGRGPGRPGRQPCRDGPIRSGLRGPASSRSRRPSWRNRADGSGGAVSAGRGPPCFPVIVAASAWLRSAARMRACMCLPLAIALPCAHRASAAPGTGMRWRAERHPFTPPVTRQCVRASVRRLPEAAVMPLVFPARPEGRAAGAGPQFQPERERSKP